MAANDEDAVAADRDRDRRGDEQAALVVNDNDNDNDNMYYGSTSKNGIINTRNSNNNNDRKNESKIVMIEDTGNIIDDDDKDGDGRNEDKGNGNRGKVIILIFTAMVCALASGTANSFGALFSGDIKDDLGLSGVMMAGLTSCGQLGLYFTVPTGYIQDRYGLRVTGLFGAFAMLIGGWIMSFCNEDSAWIMLAGMTLIGFGGGASFMAALSCAPKLLSEKYSGFALAVVSSSMSLSVAYVVLLIRIYKDVSDCTDVSCWRDYFRFLFSLNFIMMISAPYFYGPKQEKIALLNDAENLLNSPRYVVVTIRESLNMVLRHGYFWKLFLGYYAGVSAGILILTSTRQISNKYLQSGDIDEDLVALGFSITTCFSGIVSGYLGDRFRLVYNTSRSYVVVLFFGFQSLVFLAMGIIAATKDKDIALDQSLEQFFAAMMVLSGLSFGSTFSIFPALVSDCYGTANFGVIFGYLQFSSCFGAVSTPLISQQMKSATGDFTVMFFFLGAVMVVSLLFLLFSKTDQQSLFYKK